jgi:hypothetical protein
MLNVQSNATSTSSFNSAQGPSVTEIQKVEVQKDSSTPQVPPVESKRPSTSTGDKNTGSVDDEEEKRCA